MPCANHLDCNKVQADRRAYFFRASCSISSGSASLPESMIWRMMTRIGPPSSSVCGWIGRPQPRSSRMPAAATRAAGGTVSWLTIPANTLTHSAVWPRASDRRSVGIFFRGNEQRNHASDGNSRKRYVPKIKFIEESLNCFDEQVRVIVGLGNVRKAVSGIVERVHRK